MKPFGRIVLLSLFVLAAVVITITACGGGASNGGGIGAAARAFVFNANPVGLHVTRGFATRASAAGAFVVNAQTTTPGGGNFSGFCNGTFGSGTPNARAHTVIFGLGRWSSGSCEDGVVQDTNVGVSIPQNGQIGNLTVDAIGTGTAADSGQLQLIVIHSDGTRTTIPLGCTFGISSPGRVHCEDKNAADHFGVVAGDQIAAFFFWTPFNGDTYNAIRVNIEYATPTF
jgi:hypothetical protein